MSPLARRSLRAVTSALRDRPGSEYGRLSQALAVLDEQGRLVDPEYVAELVCTALSDAADRVETDITVESHTEAHGKARVLELLRAIADESGKGTLTGELTRVDDGVARCVVCGCTEDNACPGSCTWVPNALMLEVCSACVPDAGEPVQLRWDGTLTLPAPSGSPEEQPATVPMRTDAGVPAVLTLTWQQRLQLTSLLDLHVMDTRKPCTTPQCGISDQELRETVPQLGVPPYGWILVQVHGTGDPERWVCSTWCAQAAIARAADQLAADGLAAEHDEDEAGEPQ